MSMQTLSLVKRGPPDAAAGPALLSTVAAREPETLRWAIAGSWLAVPVPPILAPVPFCRRVCRREGAGPVDASFVIPAEEVEPSRV